MPLSRLAENLIGSEIIHLAQGIKKRISEGQHIYNYTIGDFDPEIFPIPELLKKEIIGAINNNQSNYPPPNGVLELRRAVSDYLKKNLDVDYSSNEVLISGGARPLIYAAYRAIVDPNDKVIFPVPSWNNNHYVYMTSANGIAVETLPEDFFMPTAEMLMPHIEGATLLSLCSPLNPTGTTFTREGLREICEMVLNENRRRGDHEKKLYVLYDQIYWQLTYGETEHFHPVQLFPEMKEYTIYVDGISKAFAATGVRVGWTFGPEKLVTKMKGILSHVGAWSPKAEQMGCSAYLNDQVSIDNYLFTFKKELFDRLNGFYSGLSALSSKGLPIEVIKPQAALYLTVKIDLIGNRLENGKVLETSSDVCNFLIDEAQLAVVPFSSFGADAKNPWFRLSVGTAKITDIADVITRLENALDKVMEKADI